MAVISRRRILRVLLLTGAGLALGAMAVALLPGMPSWGRLRLGIYVLLATPWAAVLVCLVVSVFERSWRRMAVLLSLLALAAVALIS